MPNETDEHRSEHREDVRLKRGNEELQDHDGAHDDPPTESDEEAPMDPPGDFVKVVEALNASSSFYDVDDISLTSIPFDAVDVEEL